MRLLQAELVITLEAYALAAIPVAGVAFSGRGGIARVELVRWWSRFALPMALVLVEWWATK